MNFEKYVTKVQKECFNKIKIYYRKQGRIEETLW